MRTFLRQVLLTLVMAVAIYFILQNTIQSSIVVGTSMEPNFQHNQRLLINQVIYRFNEPQRGDVIIFHPLHSPKADPLIKRVIGLPGESVEIKQGKVHIHRDGDVFIIDEPYIDDPPTYTFRSGIIPEDEYFVLGDNRNGSNDSHNDWTVPRKDIIGEVCLSIWPPGEWGLIPNYPYHNNPLAPTKVLPQLR